MTIANLPEPWPRLIRDLDTTFQRLIDDIANLENEHLARAHPRAKRLVKSCFLCRDIRGTRRNTSDAWAYFLSAAHQVQVREQGGPLGETGE